MTAVTMKVVDEKLVSALTSVMNSRHNPSSRLFLILAFACAFFVGGTETQARARDKGARLIVQRAANFGNEIAVDLSIDGKRVAYIQRDHRYDGFVSAGRHVLTVLPMPNVDLRRPTSLRVTVRSGRTYIFTAAWEPDRGVVLGRATFAINAMPAPSPKAPTR
jgi:hypothetical protein